MGRVPTVAHLWPGLPLILANGSWLGLAWAAGFALLVNLLLLGGLWWPELYPVHVRNGIWLLTFVFWGGAVIATSRGVKQLGPRDEVPGEPTFADATNLYLQGDWFGAEQLLVGLLRSNPRDVEAGLMLATLWRHTARLKEASRQLERLELLDESRKWAFEIYQERKRLESARQEPRKPSETVVEVDRAA